MSNNPLNLALRFILEMAALVAMAWWGWAAHTGGARWLWAIALPLLAAVVWGVFRVPNDPRDAPVAVPGPARLLIEAAVFGGATWCLYAAGRASLAWLFGGIVLLHYLASYDRVTRLLGIARS